MTVYRTLGTKSQIVIKAKSCSPMESDKSDLRGDIHIDTSNHICQIHVKMLPVSKLAECRPTNLTGEKLHANAEGMASLALTSRCPANQPVPRSTVHSSKETNTVSRRKTESKEREAK
jgi:hypothetical protein